MYTPRFRGPSSTWKRKNCDCQKWLERDVARRIRLVRQLGRWPDEN